MVYGSIIIIWEEGGPNYLGHPPRLIVATIFLKLGCYFRGGFLIIYSSAIPPAAIFTLKVRFKPLPCLWKRVFSQIKSNELSADVRVWFYHIDNLCQANQIRFNWGPLWEFHSQVCQVVSHRKGFVIWKLESNLSAIYEGFMMNRKLRTVHLIGYWIVSYLAIGFVAYLLSFNQLIA